jgi:hypothetical protein
MNWRARAGITCIPWLAVWTLAGCDAFDASLLAPVGSAARDAGADRADSHSDRDAAMSFDAHVPPAAAGGGHSALDSGAPDARAVEGGSSDDDAGSTGTSHDAGSDAGPLESMCVATSVDFCAHVPALPAPAVIDGELDCGPLPSALDPLGWNGAEPIPAGHATSIAAAWRPDGLYFFAKVVAASVTPHTSGGLNCGDAVELYVDADGTIDASGAYADPGTMQFIIAAPSSTAPGTLDAVRYVNGALRTWSSPNVQTARLADGYAVEAFIAAADIGLSAWSPSVTLAVDVVIDVSGSANFRCGNQVGQYFLKLNPSGDCAGTRGEPWCDSRSFCTPALDAPP